MYFFVNIKEKKKTLEGNYAIFKKICLKQSIYFDIKIFRESLNLYNYIFNCLIALIQSLIKTAVSCRDSSSFASSNPLLKGNELKPDCKRS